MNWTDLVWLGLGVGLGLSWRWRSPIAEPMPQPDRSREQHQPHSLQSLQLAYQLASEMSQFKGGFLARTSHELRSPLNGMIGMQQLILQDLCDSPEEEREFIAQANQSALKMIKVLDSVLAVARLQHGTVKMELQPLQLAAQLQAAHDLTYLQAADRNLQLRVTLPDPALYVVADPRYLQQVLLYLIDMPIAQMEEGSIQVSAHTSAETGYAQIWIDSDRSLTFSEPIDRLQTSLTTDSPLPSPGLNLLTSQILISLMQGTLAVVEASEGRDWTRLQCSMPLVLPDPLVLPQ